jgi:hypothetical protein
MLGTDSIWTNIACIAIGCISLVGLGVLFVKATNIERRWLVAGSTLVGCAFALYLMIEDMQFVPGRELPTGIAAIAISLIGFFAGRAMDASLGGQTPDPSAGFHPDLAD